MAHGFLAKKLWHVVKISEIKERTKRWHMPKSKFNVHRFCRIDHPFPCHHKCEQKDGTWISGKKCCTLLRFGASRPLSWLGFPSCPSYRCCFCYLHMVLSAGPLGSGQYDGKHEGWHMPSICHHLLPSGTNQDCRNQETRNIHQI